MNKWDQAFRVYRREESVTEENITNAIFYTGILSSWVSILDEINDEKILIAAAKALIAVHKNMLTSKNFTRHRRRYLENDLENKFSPKIINIIEKHNLLPDKRFLEHMKKVFGLHSCARESIKSSLTYDMPLLDRDIMALSKEDMNYIFDNYKKIRCKVRLFMLSKSTHFDEGRHLPIALKHIGMKSFISSCDKMKETFDGCSIRRVARTILMQPAPLNFKASYFKRMSVSDPRFYKIIELVTRTKFANDLRTGKFSFPHRCCRDPNIPFDEQDLILSGDYVNYNYKHSFGGSICSTPGRDIYVVGTDATNVVSVNFIEDLEKSEIEALLFPILLRNKVAYNIIMKNLGYMCRLCGGTGTYFRTGLNYYDVVSEECPICRK